MAINSLENKIELIDGKVKKDVLQKLLKKE